MNLHIRNAGEEREQEPMITQKAHARVCKEKDHQYHEVYVNMNKFIKLSKENYEGFKLMEAKYLKQKRMTYYVGGVTYLIGGLTAWLTL